MITGAGGEQAILFWKALRQSKMALKIIACDCSHMSAGLYRTEKSYTVPPAGSSDYVQKIIDIVKKENVHIIMTGNMAEMEVLSKQAASIERETGAYVVAPPPKALDIAKDKWRLAVFLKEYGFDHPKSAIPEEKDDLENFLKEVPLPYVVKDRFGAGSKNLSIVREKENLAHALAKIKHPVLQEYLFPDDEEYTVGCFCDSDSNPVGSIAMKRRLGHGLTHKAQVVDDPRISQYCEKVARAIGLVGPSNLQLRLTDRGPVIFEINPRFSSTESARAYYNFNMPEMCIRHFVLNEPLSRPETTTGYFFRVFDDVFVASEDVENMAQTGESVTLSGERVDNF